MNRIILAAAAAAAAALPLAIGGAAHADPGDYAKKKWEKRADCEKKLSEADSRREFAKVAAECSRELAKLDREQRQETLKAWRESEKKWRERHGGYDGGYYPWRGDDDED